MSRRLKLHSSQTSKKIPDFWTIIGFLECAGTLFLAISRAANSHCNVRQSIVRKERLWQSSRNITCFLSRQCAHKMQTKHKKLLAVITSTPNFGFTGALKLLCHVRNYTQDCNEKFNTTVCSIMPLMLFYVIVDVAVPSYLVAWKCYCAQYDPSFAKLATEYCVSLDICHQPLSSVMVKSK